MGGTTVNSPSRNEIQCCFEHAEEELKLYCETCGELVCYQCVIKGGKHHNHDYAQPKIALERKEEIKSLLEPMEKQVTIIKKALEQLNTRCGEISDQRAAIEDNIHVTFRRLREVLKVRETDLITQLHQMTQAKLKDLASQSDQIKTTLAELNSCLHFMGESLKTGNENNVLMMKANTVQQVKKLTTPFQPDMLKPNTEANMAFSALANMTAMCQNYGQVHVYDSKSLPDPSNCHIIGNCIEEAAVGVKSTAILQAINLRGRPCEEIIKLLECELVSKITGTRASCSVERRGQSQYAISYQPTSKGRHHLCITMEGQHIRGSPFSVAVTSPVIFGTAIQTMDRVREPWGVAITPRWEVVVTERGGHCVSMLSIGGEKYQSFGIRGSGQGHFNEPCGIAVDGEGNILVADCGNNRIQKFTAEGQFLAAVGTKGNGPLQFNKPTGIAFSAISRKVYLSEYGNSRCHILNSDLTFSSTFGSQGRQLKHPAGIACDSTGKVYVADRHSHCIHVFTTEGMLLTKFGQRGSGRGYLNEPYGIAVDTSGMVYVSEVDNNRVSVFTSVGHYVTSFGMKGKGPGQFMFPASLAIDSGVVYVCDYYNSRVQMF